MLDFEPTTDFSYENFLSRLDKVLKTLIREIYLSSEERGYGSETPPWMKTSKYRFILALSMTTPLTAEALRLSLRYGETDYESVLPVMAEVNTETPLGILYVFNDFFNNHPELLGQLCADPQSIFGDQLPALWEFLSGITAYQDSPAPAQFGPEIDDSIEPVLKTARKRLRLRAIKSVLSGVERAVIQEVDENEFFAKAAALAALEVLSLTPEDQSLVLDKFQETLSCTSS